MLTEEQASELEAEAMAHLELYGPGTYAMAWNRADEARKFAERQGWIKWVPPVLGTCWAITEAGKKRVGLAGAPDQ